ncbi:MAG: hypothetical protein IKU25_01040 [Clostridia bacterium]|nr:hypothetical protein [Clostridia bacterium]
MNRPIDPAFEQERFIANKTQNTKKAIISVNMTTMKTMVAVSLSIKPFVNIKNNGAPKPVERSNST